MALPTLLSVAAAVVYLRYVFRVDITSRHPSNTKKRVNMNKPSMISGVFGLFLSLGLVLSGQFPVWIVSLAGMAVVMLKDCLFDFIAYRKHMDNQDMAVNTVINDPNQSEIVDEVIELSCVQVEGESSNVTASDAALVEQPWQSDGSSVGTLIDDPKDGFHLKRFTMVRVLLRLPWDLVPFCLSMFILVEALSKVGVTAALASFLSNLPQDNTTAIIYGIGFLAAIACNLLTNIPMTILFTRVLQHPNYASRSNDTAMRAAYIALIIGSNLGTNLLYIGSLAGLMWHGLIAKSKYPISQFEFFKYGSGLVVVTMTIACGVLAAEMKLFSL